MRILFYSICLLTFLGNSLRSQNTVNETILFDTYKSELTFQHKEILNNLLGKIKHFNQYKILIEGHTDHIGDSLSNIELSQQRSTSVLQFLIQSDIPQSKMITSFHGENKPKADNITVEGRKTNRRTDIFVQEILPKKTLKDLYEQLRPDSQIFCISPDKDTVLVAKKGTILYFRANSFNLNSDTLEECIKIIVKERFKRSEMFLDDLTTISGGDIIISQSMLYIDATYKGSRVELTKDITAMTPTDTIIPDMKLFYGKRDSNGNMNWNLSSNQLTNINGSIFGPCSEIVDGIVGGTLNDGCMQFPLQTLRNLFSSKKDNNTLSDSITSPLISIDPCKERQRKLKEFEEKYKDINIDKLKDIPREDVKYYVFNRRLGWSNLDWMMKVKNKITFRVYQKPQDNLDIKVVFKKYRSIIPLYKEKSFYYYKQAPLGYKAWLLALKYENDIPMLALEEITIDQKGIRDLNFKAYSIPELKRKLKVLDR